MRGDPMGMKVLVRSEAVNLCLLNGLMCIHSEGLSSFCFRCLLHGRGLSVSGLRAVL